MNEGQHIIYKLSSGAEVIGRISSERKTSVTLKDAIQIIQIRTVTGSIYPYFQPFTVQSLREELPPVNIQHSSIVAMYRPTPIIFQEYQNELERLEETRNMPEEEFESQIEEQEQEDLLAELEVDKKKMN